MHEELAGVWQMALSSSEYLIADTVLVILSCCSEEMKDKRSQRGEMKIQD